MKKAPRMKDIQNLIASYTANGITAHTYDFSKAWRFVPPMEKASIIF